MRGAHRLRSVFEEGVLAHQPIRRSRGQRHSIDAQFCCRQYICSTNLLHLFCSGTYTFVGRFRLVLRKVMSARAKEAIPGTIVRLGFIPHKLLPTLAMFEPNEVSLAFFVDFR